MLTRLDLRNFKCFQDLQLPLAPLTLLAGGNASGKSTILQSLVLLHQTIRENEWSTRLMLNGESIRLGTVLDVVDEVNGKQSFEIGLTDATHSYQWIFRGERSNMSIPVEELRIGANRLPTDSLRFLLPPVEASENLSFCQSLLGLTYITAERVGPREVYPLVDHLVAPVVGAKGEYTASVLYQGRDEKALAELSLPSVPPTRLHQVKERMRAFFPGCDMDIQLVARTNSVKLGLKTSTDTDFHRPIHVGFGLTQVLPIIVAALSAKAGDIILIENPEVHLHPSGQAQMGQFLAEVAKAGVQVIVETHSDHVLNGIRRYVREERISPDEIAIHFFQQRTESGAQVISPQIDKFGNLSEWPAGFFDQFDKDANYFAGWGE